MRSGIGSSLSRGHERSPLDAAVSTFHSLSKFPLLPCGAIAFVAGVALGMSDPAAAANLAVSYSATGELADPDGNTTPIDVQNTASDSTAGKSRSVSLKLDNKTITTDGRTVPWTQAHMCPPSAPLRQHGVFT